MMRMNDGSPTALQESLTPERERVAEALREIFARPEFELKEESESGFWDWLDQLSMPGLDGDQTRFLLSMLLAGAVFLALWGAVILRSRASFAARDSKHRDDAQKRAYAVDLVRQAQLARQQQEPRLALRMFFRALVVGLGENGSLVFQDSWTNRELLERGEPSPELRSELEPWVPRLDGVLFGAEPVLQGDLEGLAQLCSQRLGVTIK